MHGTDNSLPPSVFVQVFICIINATARLQRLRSYSAHMKSQFLRKQIILQIFICLSSSCCWVMENCITHNWTDVVQNVLLEISGKIGNRNTSSKWWRVSFADRNCSAPFSKAIQGVVKVQLVSKGCVMFWGEKLVHALETVLYCPELYIQTPPLHRPVSA